MRTLLHRRRGAESGQTSLEFVGTLFMWLVIVLVTLQILLAMFALAQANSAARNAARSEVISAGSGQAAGLCDELPKRGLWLLLVHGRGSFLGCPGGAVAPPGVGV